MKFQPVINLIGLLLCTLSAFMLIPGFIDYVLGDEDWAAFLVSSFITLFVGAGLFRHEAKTRGVQQPARS